MEFFQEDKNYQNLFHIGLLNTKNIEWSISDRMPLSVSGSHLKAVVGYPYPIENILLFRIYTRQTGELARGVHGVDFGFLDPDSRCLQQDQKRGFSCCSWSRIGFGFCVCWQNVTFCLLHLYLYGVRRSRIAYVMLMLDPEQIRIQNLQNRIGSGINKIRVRTPPILVPQLASVHWHALQFHCLNFGNWFPKLLKTRKFSLFRA